MLDIGFSVWYNNLRCHGSDNLKNIGVSPSGKASDSDSAISRVQILPPQPLKPHRSDAVLFYADIKTLKDYKAIVGILSKTKHRPFSHSAKGPVILLFVMLICQVQSYP